MNDRASDFWLTCPQGWRVVPIRDCLYPIIDPIEMSDDEIYDLVSIRRRNGGMFFRESLPGRKILTKTLQRLHAGSFVIARMQIVHGACALTPDSFAGAAISQSYSAFRGSDICSSKYFARLAEQPFMVEYFLKCSHGVVIEKMTFQQDRWLDQLVCLPPLEEQWRIAEILDTIDEAIQATARVITKLAFAHEGLIRSILDSCDDGQRVPLRQVAEVSGGLSISAGRPVSDPVDVPYLRVANVQDGFIDTSTMRTVRISRADVGRYALNDGDVLMNEGGDFDKLGRGAVWDGRVSPCLHQNHVFRVRCDPKAMIPEFLSLFCQSREGKAYFVNNSKQTTNLASINKTQIESLPTLVPSLDAQQRIVDTQRASISLAEVQKCHLAKLNKTRTGLAADLLSGRIRTVAS